MQEQIIISMTTWKARIANIPVVLDSIYKQMLLPDKVVINLAYSEEIPPIVQDYITKHGVEVFRTKDTKVYKKLIPTLLRYPDACVINIDDDCIYPIKMIEEFVELHRKYPNFPISGNKVIMYGMQCHCGCASMTKYEYFGEMLDYVDDDLIASCPSDDMVFTYLATLNGHPYIHTENEYFENLVSKEIEYKSYSQTVVNPQDGISKTYSYLSNRFVPLPISTLGAYVNDNYMAILINYIEANQIQYHERIGKQIAEAKIRSSHSYRLGKFLLKPFRWMKNLSKHKAVQNKEK